jgi:hypothetical protein
MSVARLMQMAAAGVSAAGGPELVGIENTVDPSSATPSLTLPSGISSGDIILIFVGVDGTPTASITGFTQEIGQAGGWAASASYYVFSKVADGTEGASVTLTLSASEAVCASAWVITNANDVAFSAVATNAGSVNPDSPSLTSGFGAVSTFWISSFATDNGTPTISAYPSGYENGQSLSAGASFGSTRLGVSSTVASVATEDPPAYTISEAHNWIAVTVAVGTAAPAEWTDPDLANSSYDSVSFSVAGQDTSPQGLSFNDDGSKLYVLGSTNDAVNEYDLSTAWDVSTASYLHNFSVSSQETAPQGLFFKPDGFKMYVAGAAGDDVNEYDLSTAWDVSSSSFLQNLSVAAQENSPSGIFFKPDGTKMYLSGITGDDINEYDLSTAWDVSTASYVQSVNLVLSSANPQSVFFNPEGTKMFIAFSTGDDINEWDLSTAWDVSTASFTRVFSVSSQETFPTGLFFKSDGSKMYVVGSGTDTIYQYSTA